MSVSLTRSFLRIVTTKGSRRTFADVHVNLSFMTFVAKTFGTTGKVLRLPRLRREMGSIVDPFIHVVVLGSTRKFSCFRELR